MPDITIIVNNHSYVPVMTSQRKNDPYSPGRLSFQYYTLYASLHISNSTLSHTPYTADPDTFYSLLLSQYPPAARPGSG